LPPAGGILEDWFVAKTERRGTPVHYVKEF